MTHAAITGWGKCLPPAVLTNADLATFLDTDDEWITSRTGMRERRVSHVPLADLVHVASARALACAGLPAAELDLIVVGATIGDQICPNVASGIQKRLGAARAACMDVNTACTSFLYGLSLATALVLIATPAVTTGTADLPPVPRCQKVLGIVFCQPAPTGPHYLQ